MATAAKKTAAAKRMTARKTAAGKKDAPKRTNAKNVGQKCSVKGCTFPAKRRTRTSFGVSG